MVAPIDICNAALMRVGGNAITSLTENTVAAKACNASYDIVRRDLLRSHPWNFALKYAELAQDATKPIFGYDFSFTLPSDCLRVISTAEQEENNYLGLGSDFNGFVTISSSVDYAMSDQYKIIGRHIYSNNNKMLIKYISDVEDTSLFDPSFIELFAVRLAMTISYKISGSVQSRADLEREFQYLLTNAMQVNGQEGTRERIERSLWLVSRR